MEVKMTTWIKQVNKTCKTDYPHISIRTLGIGLSSNLIKEANAEHYEYAEVFLSEDKSKLAIKFTEKSNDAYKVTQDGGSKERKRVTKSLNRFIACGNVIRSSNVLKQLSERNVTEKIFAKKIDDLWVINLTPCFLYNTKNYPLAYDDIGVYRYILNDEVVYIGRGKIKQRICSPERCEWVYDDIEFMITSDKASVIIEENLLQEFKDINGELPLYNKILGCKNDN